MSGPIKAQDIVKAKTTTIPDEVFDAFNELIASKWDGRSAHITQDEVVKLSLVKLQSTGKDISRNKLFESGWLDIEDSYREAGWDVGYDKPGYNESYEAFFVFSKTKQAYPPVR